MGNQYMPNSNEPRRNREHKKLPSEDSRYSEEKHIKAKAFKYEDVYDDKPIYKKQHANDTVSPNKSKYYSNNKKKKGLLSKFLLTVVVILCVFFVGSIAVIYGYSKMNGKPFSENVKEVALGIESNLRGTNSKNTSSGLGDLFSSVPKHTNFAIFGTDKDGDRTDVMIVGTFNSETEKVTLISVPRDTYVTMPKERLEILNNAGLKTAPSSGIMKINAVTHHAGKEYGIPFAVKQLEELMGIEIEYYVKVDLEAFRFIVDEIGGVSFDVPQRLYYNDPEQGLFIDLYPGEQVLNGSQAEGLVRYRKADINNPISKGYAAGDLTRVKVQQDFIKALVTQMLSRENFLNNISAIFETFSKYVETNVAITELPKYSKFLLGFQAESIDTFTLPGNDETINRASYFILDELETKKLAEEVFYSDISNEAVNNSEQPIDIVVLDSKSVTIQVLNGGYVTGLAGETRDRLNEAGYNVKSIGDYKDTKTENTRIIVRKEGMGEDLTEFFSDSQIVVDSTIHKNYDIIIILGTSER